MHTCFFFSSSFFFPLLQHLPNTDGGWCFDDGGNFTLGYNYANVKAPALGCDTGQGTSSKPRWRLDLSLLLCGGRPPTLKFTLESDGRGKKKPLQKLSLLFFLRVHSAAPQLGPPTGDCTSWRSCRREEDAMQGCAEQENNLPSFYSSLPTPWCQRVWLLCPWIFSSYFFPSRIIKKRRKKKKTFTLFKVPPVQKTI